MDTVHECDRQTDGRTDRQTELLSQRPCNAERRTVKMKKDDENSLLAYEMRCYSNVLDIGWQENKANRDWIKQKQL